MSNTLKVVIAVAVAIVVGLVAGYMLGSGGRGDLKRQLKSAENKLKAATAGAKEKVEQQEASVAKDVRSKALLRAKVELLWALVNLHANNYGTANQHLDVSTRRLAKAKKASKGPAVKKLEKFLADIADAQKLVLRLDPMARSNIEGVLVDLRKFPGAR
jgi:hypothetical protein